MEKLDVLYTINPEYLEIMLASLYSLVLNSGISNLRIHIITESFSLEDYKRIEKAMACFDNIEYYFYDLSCFDISKFNIPDWRGSQIANARLFFSSILASRIGNISNLFYLDADTLVINNLNGLSAYQNNSINAVKENVLKSSYRRLGTLKQYYNSGVLFFNVLEWLDHDLEEKIKSFIANNKRELIYPDQDIINCALQSEVSSMPLEYNLTTTNALFGPVGNFLFFANPNRNGSFKETRIAKKNTKIIHASGLLTIKPWTNNKINPFNEEWVKYLKMVNNDFQSSEIEGIKKIFAFHPWLFKLLLITQNYLPEEIQSLKRKIVKKLEK